MSKIKVAIAEDNDNLAQSIKEKIELIDGDLEFVFRACNGVDLMRKLNENHAVDTILMDIQMPELDGIEATEMVKKKYPGIKIIMLTVFDDDDKIFRSILAGANGYLLKDEPPDKILESIHIIYDGGAPMTASIAAKSLELLRNPERVEIKKEEKSYALSARETEVLEHLSTGLNYNEIAEALFISPQTVRKHIQNIYEKLQVHNKVSAIRKAINNKLI
ncbi:MAG: DNA-binding response regulator [Ignavibacteria bacterium]|nr:MAG: DNA-binding response regulator [Ignavibacteria bacterium]